MTTPRCFIVRHGETEWSLSGKHTGTTDISLTADGEKRVQATGSALVGDDRLIVPKKLKHIYVSPRHRAQRTLELLDLGCHDPYPWQTTSPTTRLKDPNIAFSPSTTRHTDATVTITEDIAEWNYGDYEGITSKEIAEIRRREDPTAKEWNIWTDGCPGGESPDDITRRLDRLINHIRTNYHAPAMQDGGKRNDHDSGDVLVVAHGHILRAFAMRWVGEDLNKTALIMEAGGVGTLSYEHKNIKEPAILLGGGFVVGT